MGRTEEASVYSADAMHAVAALRCRCFVAVSGSCGLRGVLFFFFFQAEDGIRDYKVTGVQTCALPIWARPARPGELRRAPRPARWCRGDRANPLHKPPSEGHARGRDPRSRGARER